MTINDLFMGCGNFTGKTIVTMLDATGKTLYEGKLYACPYEWTRKEVDYFRIFNDGKRLVCLI